MDDTLSTLGAYVASKDSRLACAAAVILTELAPKDAAVVRQLAAALEHADPVRRPFVIEALGRIGTADAAAALAPLIKGGGPAGEQALRAIAHTASAALKPLLALIGKVPPELLERISESVARTGEPAAFATLTNALANAEVDACRAIRAGLRAAMTASDAKFKENLRKQLEKAFYDRKLVQHHPALIAIIKIAGDLGDTSLQGEMLSRTAADFPLNVRRAALQGLARLHLSGEQRAQLAPQLLPLMLENDAGNLAEPAMEALRQAQLNSEHQNTLRKLLASTSSGIREFAMQALAAQGTSRTLHELIECLDSPDRLLREEALSALSRAPAAAGPLCERLIGLEAGIRAAETARALAPQATHIPRKSLNALAAQYVALATAPAQKSNGVDSASQAAEKRRAILNVFRAGSSPLLVETVFACARKLRMDGEAGQAHELLKNVSGLNGWTDDCRVEMALAGLSAGPKDLSRAARANDANLQIVEELLSSQRKRPAELSRQLHAESTLPRKLLHYLGFHFAERMHDEREFGKLVLEQLAASAARSEEGRLAREKLVIEGLVAARGGKAGILEERAKVLMSAADLAAESAEATRAPVKAPASKKKQASVKTVLKPKAKSRNR